MKRGKLNHEDVSLEVDGKDITIHEDGSLEYWPEELMVMGHQLDGLLEVENNDNKCK